VDYDVVIIGAGAAGIAAARRLHGRGRRVLIVEAMERVGGRAHTITVDDLRLDLGAGWLHSAERNPLVAEAEALGLAIDRSEAAWGRQLRNLGFSETDQHDAWGAYGAFEERLAEAPEGDIAGNAIERDHPWRGYVDMISGALNGAETDRVSAADLTAYEGHASETNWRLPRGYGTLIAALADPLLVQLSTAVMRVEALADGVRVHTRQGAIDASTAIVAVPSDVLAKGHIAFSPILDAHLHAASQLPLGRVDKLFLRLPHGEALPTESHLVGNPHTARTGSYYIRPFGLPVIECFFGGIAARAMEDAGDDGRLAFAVEELGALLGSDLARGLTPLAGSWWHRQPTIGGAYSHALPGQAGQRQVLATPPSERLAFAGEACSTHDYSTVHGAWASGIAAAAWVERALRR
jgi:monoamine oxidase